MALIGDGGLKCGIDDAMLIFDWCDWGWELDGNNFLWDDDFRFHVYTLSLSKLEFKQVCINTTADM